MKLGFHAKIIVFFLMSNSTRDPEDFSHSDLFNTIQIVNVLIS